MFSTQEILLIVGFAVLVVAFAIVAARMAGRSEETLTVLREEREAETARPAPRPAKAGTRKERKRR